MPSHPEGLAIARVRIAEEKEKRTGFIDLGRLGLTELPEELFELEYLWGLNWGSGGGMGRKRCMKPLRPWLRISTLTNSATFSVFPG
jgi:hypothetical protein